MRRLVPVILVALVLISVAACGSGSDESTTTLPATDRKDPAPTSPVRSTATTGSTSTTTTPLGSGSSVSIAFAGDASFQGLDSAVRSDPSSVLAAIAPSLGDADLTMVNLEAAIGAGGSPESKAFNFQTPPEALDALGAAGVDVVTVANNHGRDFGSGGLDSTLEVKSQGRLPMLGVGNNRAEAFAPWITEVRGQRIAFMSATDVLDGSLMTAWTATEDHPGLASIKGDNLSGFIEALRAVRATVNTVVVYLHYGIETHTCPSPRQRDVVEQLIGAGADIVVGSHAHRLQGAGMLGDKFVAYGLGNFVFRPGSATGRETGVLVVRATGTRIDGFEWRPAVIDGAVPVPLTGVRAADASAYFDGLRGCAGLLPSP